MSHPDPLHDYSDFDANSEAVMFPHVDSNYDDHNDFYGEVTADDLDRLGDMIHGEDWDDEDYYDDSMDGDHDSSMESAGWGTDEDYGYYGDDY